MVKSKTLKLLRKQVEKAEKTPDVLKSVDLPEFDDLQLDYVPDRLAENDLEMCLKLFSDNMGEMYQNSSWGLDMDEKRSEFTHRTSRFLLLKSGDSLAAFLHFRFCLDDDDEPTRSVLYVYEIQVQDEFRRRGIGAKLMSIVENIAKSVNLGIVLLTVFKSNANALQFYTEKLGYIIDETSPSKFDQIEDFEILSKAFTIDG